LFISFVDGEQSKQARTLQLLKFQIGVTTTSL